MGCFCSDLFELWQRGVLLKPIWRYFWVFVLVFRFLQLLSWLVWWSGSGYVVFEAGEVPMRGNYIWSGG